jgi:hypothetical protein
MSYMVYPDSPELRDANEITFRTRLADWYSGIYAKKSLKFQKELLQSAHSKLGKELSRAAHPSEWMRNKLFSDFLKPFGDLIGATVALTNSPSEKELNSEWTRRWFGVVYTGKLVCLIGSIAQHHAGLGASLNKAIHVLRETEGNNKELNAGFRQFGYPGIYDSSLKKAWRLFKPVAHLCAAYVTTETHFYEGEIASDFMDYWQQSPALYDDDAFRTFCLVAKSVEHFVTEFRPHGLRHALIPEDEIFRLPNEICDPARLLPKFRALTEKELAALGTYRAPKSFVV